MMNRIHRSLPLLYPYDLLLTAKSTTAHRCVSDSLEASPKYVFFDLSIFWFSMLWPTLAAFRTSPPTDCEEEIPSDWGVLEDAAKVQLCELKTRAVLPSSFLLPVRSEGKAEARCKRLCSLPWFPVSTIARRGAIILGENKPSECCPQSRTR